MISLLPRIYTIQASDAPQHSETLREILSELESENRIIGVTALDQDSDLSSISGLLKKDDMILIVLTNKIQLEREEIEIKCTNLKSKTPGLRLAEIIVDNIAYDNDFIIYPADLRPIRNREDMDGAWNSIETRLKNMFPVKVKQDTKPFPAWMVIVAIGILLLGGLAWYLFTPGAPKPLNLVEETVSGNFEVGNAFLKENAESYDVMVTESGLQYRVIEEGSGASPTAEDIVEVHYRGTLISGEEFDSSYGRNDTATFPLNRVIPGWTEGLQLMSEGATYEFFLPSELGYGNNPPPGSIIEPGSVLIFKVVLIDIKE